MTEQKPTHPLDDGFMYRIPGRDYRVEITHKRWRDMNRHERRLMDKAYRTGRLALSSTPSLSNGGA